MDYHKKKLRLKLSCLDRVLKEGSSLRTDGCMESAWVTLKARVERQEEAVL